MRVVPGWQRLQHFCSAARNFCTPAQCAQSSTGCSECQDGTFADPFNTTWCEPCPANMLSSKNHTYCHFCLAGFQPAAVRLLRGGDGI